jgi:hypothetical protein
MRLRRVIVVFAAAVGLSVGVPQAISAAYAAAPTVALNTTAGVHHPAMAAHAEVIPFIQWRSCSGQTTHWVSVDVITASGLQDWCFGYDGTWYFNAPNNVVTSVCAGNNEGRFTYINPSNGLRDIFTLTPGAEFYAHGGVKAVSLQIWGWTGNDTCTS